MLSLVIPTFKEGKIIESSIKNILKKLNRINYEIIIVDDNSNDGTFEKVNRIAETNSNISIFINPNKKGFGNSIKEGIARSKGDYICFVMADKSDDPKDIISYYDIIKLGDYDCVFGDRWVKPNSVKNYPKFKFFLNRVGNIVMSKIFNIEYTDITNSFKMYRKDLLLEISPLISNHFSITIEIPLKTIYRGYNYKVIPNTWRNDKLAVSNLKLWNVFFTYSLILFYCRIEKYFFKH